MDDFTSAHLIAAALIALAAVFMGYMVGVRRARAERRELQRDLNARSLELLDYKTRYSKGRKLLDQAHRKDKLLRLTLNRLRQANGHTARLADQLRNIEKKHYIALSKLRLVATSATEKAKRAEALAIRATNHLKRLERVSPVTQTIQAPQPKSYGKAESIPVKVVDQQLPEAQNEAVKRVSNRDSMRLTSLRSSNEGNCFEPGNLQAIDGIDNLLEEQLNRAGIHRVEQLANMSDSELAALSESVSTPAGSIDKSAWKNGAQDLLNQL